MIFVFGSNREGRHGAGAALYAVRFCGAVYGQAEGRQGNSYAIVTKELRKNQPTVTLKEIEDGVSRFLRYAKENNTESFLLTPIGCGLAGLKPSEIGPLFSEKLPNIQYPDLFIPYIQGK